MLQISRKMSIESTFGNLFKPEIKSSGRKLVAEEKVSLGSFSDTSVQAYVRVSPPFRVKLESDDIANPNFTAECNCPVAKKNRFCKHIWATLLLVEEKHPDFLNAKTEIGKQESAVRLAEIRAEAEAASVIKGGLNSSSTHEQNSNFTGQVKTASAKTDYQETAKKRASDYRKAQYQKHKQHTKAKKRERMGLESASSLPSFTPEVEASLAYFTENGFPMPAGPSKEILAEAKRKLSRVFHPDKGGSHEESVELNRNCDVLLEFFRISF